MPLLVSGTMIMMMMIIIIIIIIIINIIIIMMMKMTFLQCHSWCQAQWVQNSVKGGWNQRLAPCTPWTWTGPSGHRWTGSTSPMDWPGQGTTGHSFTLTLPPGRCMLTTLTWRVGRSVGGGFCWRPLCVCLCLLSVCLPLVLPLSF